MFKIGDIVRPKIGFIGHEYCFKIIEVEMNPFDEDSYKLQGIKQDLDPIYGSISFQINIINKAEQLWWKENDIELTSNVKLHYDITYLDDILDANKIDFSDFTKSLVKSGAIKIDKPNKENNKMEISEIYKERKLKT